LTFLTDLGNKPAKTQMARLTKDEQTALHKCLLFMEARVIGPIMPMQHAYAFLLVAMEEGRGVQEYAERAGVTQSVMTRILFALGRHRQKGAPGYGLVHQATDTQDLRKRRTFLTAKGHALVREIARLIRSDDQREMKLRLRDSDLMMLPEKSPRDVAHDQWLPRLIAAGRKLDKDDIKLAVGQIEALIGLRENKRVR
jgi:DNA-binding MarR family transcriptional regulator